MPGHKAIRRSCIRCKESNHQNKPHNPHRFHGYCSFKRTHPGYCSRHRCGCQPLPTTRTRKGGLLTKSKSKTHYRTSSRGRVYKQKSSGRKKKVKR